MNTGKNNKKTILVTGAYGFLGRYTTLEFSRRGYYVVGMGHGKWHPHEFHTWGIDEWYESTITFEALVNLNMDFDVIVHCGGSGSVAFSYQNPFEDFQKSVQSTLSLLEYIRLKGRQCHFIYPSSPAVQGDLGDKQIKEDDLSNPVSPYGFHKKSAEELCFSYCKNFGVKVSIIRYFSIYGPGLQKQLLWDACIKIKTTSDKISFFGTGEETRDWLFITDAASLIWFIAKNQRNSISIINGGTGIKTTISQTISKLVTCYNKKVEIEFNGVIKPGDPRFYQADISRAIELGWAPAVQLQQGIEQYLIFFKKLMND